MKWGKNAGASELFATSLESKPRKTQMSGSLGRGRPPGGPCARAVSGMSFPNPLGSARPAVGPYRKGILGEEQGAEGATGQETAARTQGVFSFANNSDAPPPAEISTFFLPCVET